MVRILKPPTPIELDGQTPSVFLAGSIEMGHALDWQAEFEKAFADENVVILNPRRDAWDASWEQSIHNPHFLGQVEWELDGQERADIVVFYFAPETKAPITLLELGLAARSGKAIVCCPEGYWRRGNVEVVCARFGIALVADLKALIVETESRLQNHFRRGTNACAQAASSGEGSASGASV